MKAVRFWFGEANDHTGIVPLAILLRHTLDSSREIVLVCRMCFVMSGRMLIDFESLSPSIPLEEEHCLDVKMSSDKIWILKDTGLEYHNISTDIDLNEAPSCCLQEDPVAEPLFQSASADLRRNIRSVFSSANVYLQNLQQLTFHGIGRTLIRRIYAACLINDRNKLERLSLLSSVCRFSQGNQADLV
ncbi:unnamed protein product [Linum trigynum]|uniref:CST complex subunit CTC1 n=1 Tax=Linum trigynum TaxID=586398 RepID=A0AAV2G2F4_9ROSI